jgi:nitrogen regulatory protein PII
MTRDGLTKMTKIEVVVEGTEVPAVRELFEAAGATGYTSLTGVSGLGHGGYHQGRLLFNEQDTLSLLITVVPDDRADGLLEGLRAMLDHASGVMFVSDTYVSRPEYFR